MTPFLSFFAEHFVSFVVVIILSKVLPKEIERNRISEKISGITSKFSLSFVRPDKNDTVLEMGTMPHRDSSDTFVLFEREKAMVDNPGKKTNSIVINPLQSASKNVAADELDQDDVWNSTRCTYM